jgi:hypothetical protein
MEYLVQDWFLQEATQYEKKMPWGCRRHRERPPEKAAATGVVKALGVKVREGMDDQQAS